MEINDLAKILDFYYQKGKEKKECNALIQCFGIKYVNLILEQNIKPEDIIEKSNLKGTTYATKLRKAIKLAKYVNLKDHLEL